MFIKHLIKYVVIHQYGIMDLFVDVNCFLNQFCQTTKLKKDIFCIDFYFMFINVLACGKNQEVQT